MISNLLYSQAGYPKLIVYNGDTVVAVTRYQVERLNIAHEVWQGSIQQNALLLNAVDSCHTGFLAADSAIYSLQSTIVIDNILIQHQSDIIDTLTSVIKDQKRVIHRLRIRKSLSQVVGTVLAVAVGYLLITHG